MRNSKDNIWAYIDGQMTQADKNAFERLLDQEPELRSKLDSYLLVDSMLKADSLRKAPSGLEKKIMSKLDTKVTYDADLDFGIIKYIWIALGIFVLILTLLGIYQTGIQTPDPSVLANKRIFEFNTNLEFFTESCRVYLYLSLFCAAVYTFAISYDHKKSVLLSA